MEKRTLEVKIGKDQRSMEKVRLEIRPRNRKNVNRDQKTKIKEIKLINQ